MKIFYKKYPCLIFSGQFLSISGAIFFSILFSLKISAQKSTVYADQTFNMLTLLEKNNYSEKRADQDLSEAAWKNLFDFLDPYHAVFLDKDIKHFETYKTRLSEMGLNHDGSFLNEVTNMYKTRLNEADSVIDNICSKPLTLEKKDTIIYEDENSTPYPLTINEKKIKWEKLIKHRALKFMITSDKTYTQKLIDSILNTEPQVREKTKKIEKRIIQRILNFPAGFESYIATLYQNAFAMAFDPHTMYFTPNDKRNFEENISTKSYSFGIDLDETPDMEIKISGIVPGSPAWNSNLLRKGDILKELQWENKKTVDLTGATVEEVQQMFSESEKDRLTLTVRRKEGFQIKVTLKKAQINADENIVKGVILSGKNKVGYISLPGFYTEWDSPGNPGCANDVAKEIIKLKADSIEGLILDLRSNGGGSMTEALNLIGIFVDEGPLCLYKQRGAKPMVKKDMNRGTVYTGPLIIMVNGMSASASELTSATLQDYHRALIVGNPTFGKASGQIVLPNDTAVDITQQKMPARDPGIGYVVTTTFKFYRITGQSHQLTGVIPDITFFNNDNLNLFREKSYKSPLPNDSVSRKINYNPLQPLPVSLLSQKSKERCSNNVSFIQTNLWIDSLEEFYSKKEIPLDIISYTSLKGKINHLIKSLDQLNNKETKTFNVINEKQDNELYNFDEYGRESNEQFVKSLKTDMLLEETYNIMNDLIIYNKQK